MDLSLHVDIHEDLSHIQSTDWDRCLGKTGVPSLRYVFLRGLEVTQCVGSDSGWFPRYITVKNDDKLLGAVACYLKMNSHGEFIFDWSWADAAQRVGLPYYPKLVVASPFSPLNGRRFLIDDSLDQELQDEVFKVLLRTLHQWKHEAVTGVHCLFITEQEAKRIDQFSQNHPIESFQLSSFLEPMPFEIRHTLQFHWHNQSYQNFDDFLACFRSKKRNQIKRERKAVRNAGVIMHTFVGREIQESHLEHAYRFYINTIDKYYWGQQYLNREFFDYIYHHMPENLCLVLAKYKDKFVGGAFNLLNPEDGVLYGRYWGCDADVDLPYLHFEVCSYTGIDLCIQRGWKIFEAGAGGGGHKYGRGFLAQKIYSAHAVYLPGFADPIRQMLRAERENLAKELKLLAGRVLK